MEEIKNKLKTCFKNCAESRAQLRKCVINTLKAGLSKDEVSDINSKICKSFEKDEVSFCGIVVAGQILIYNDRKNISKIISDDERELLKNKLENCIKKCALSKRKLRKCIINALNRGLTKSEILMVTDEIVGGIAKDQISLCGIIAIDQIIRFEEAMRATPISIGGLDDGVE